MLQKVYLSRFPPHVSSTFTFYHHNLRNSSQSLFQGCSYAVLCSSFFQFGENAKSFVATGPKLYVLVNLLQYRHGEVDVRSGAQSPSLSDFSVALSSLFFCSRTILTVLSSDRSSTTGRLSSTSTKPSNVPHSSNLLSSVLVPRTALHLQQGSYRFSRKKFKDFSRTFQKMEEHYGRSITLHFIEQNKEK